jgi:hypothetical protein
MSNCGFQELRYCVQKNARRWAWQKIHHKGGLEETTRNVFAETSRY